MSPLQKTVRRIPPSGVLRNWLGDPAVRSLLEYATENRSAFEETGVGYGETKRVDVARRRSLKLKEFQDFKPLFEARILAALPTLFPRLGGPVFTPTRIELEFVAHGDGAFFGIHRDTLGRDSGGGSRAISAVYYFHRLPRAFSGGALRLHPLAPDGVTYTDIEPENDTLAFFPSWFPHEVLPVSCPSGRFEDSRFAINCWIHRSATPEAAVAEKPGV